MFDIGWGELLIIGVVALIAIGPKELPNVLRTVGQWVGKVRRMASDFQGQFQDAIREAELDDLKKQFDDASRGLNTELESISQTPHDVDRAVSESETQAPAQDAVDPVAAEQPVASPPETPSHAPPEKPAGPMIEEVAIPPEPPRLARPQKITPASVVTTEEISVEPPVSGEPRS